MLNFRCSLLGERQSRAIRSYKKITLHLVLRKLKDNGKSMA